MSKKVFNVFSILCFALVLCFIGCTELINPKTETDINLNIDLSKIIKSTRNTGETQSSASLGENPTIKVAIYDAKKYTATTNSTENLGLITEAQAKIVDNEAKVKLNNIPVGIYAIVFAELSFSNGNSTEVMYAGNSEVFKVEASNNKISLVLTKVGNSEISPDDSNTPYEISSWGGLVDLVTKINSLSDVSTTTEFIIMNDLIATCTITVSKPVKIIAKSPVTITRYKEFSGTFFVIDTGSLELGSNENKIILDGNNINAAYPLILSSGNGLTLTNCTLQYNNLNNTAPGFGNGGAVYVSGGTFTMNNSSITDCSANENGGAVYVSGGTFTMNGNGTISNCKANDGGAVYITGKGTFNMNGGSIAECFATSSGGGVWMNDSSSFTMSGSSEIKNCNSNSEGGGVYVTDVNNPCTFEMLGSATIIDCSAVNGGGGVSYGCGINGIFKISGSAKISGNKNNSSSYGGGGIYLYGKLTMTGGTISSNEASNGDGVYVRNVNGFLSSLSMSGNAIVEAYDDVYLESGTTVTVAGALTHPIVATITPQKCEEGTQVITAADDGISLEYYVGRFTLSNEEYCIDYNGYLATVSQNYAEGLTCVVDSDNNTVTLYIRNADGLATFRKIVNGSFDSDIIVQYENNPNSTNTFSADKEYQNVNAVLESDITLSDWTPIGVYPTNTTTTAKPYSGTFDGNGKTIAFYITHDDTNMYSSGLFQMLAGTVKNLIIDGSISRNVAGYIGGITGYLNGGTIENCVNKATISNVSMTGTGGIVGYVGTAGGEITGCINLAKVLSSESSVGGIVGATGVISETSNVSISKCINMGEIFGTSNVSGILGTASALQITISDCMNIGKILANNSSNNAYAYASGITTPSAACTVSSCINVGEVTAIGTPSVQGGISSVTSNGIYTNNYYDSTKITLDDKPGITGKVTSELIALNLTDLSDQWFFAAGRYYPLPNIAGSIPGGENGEIWSDVLNAATPEVATGGGNEPLVGTEVDSLYALQAAINGDAEVIIITSNITITDPLVINKRIKICTSDSNYQLARTTEGTVKGPMFEVTSDGELTLQNIIITGGYDNGYNAAENNPFIYNNGKTVIEHSTLEYNYFFYTNAYTNYESKLIHFYGGGAIFSNGDLTINNSSMENFYINTSTSYGGTIYIESGTCNIDGLTISSCSTNRNGAALYISENASSSTVNINNSKIVSNTASTNGGGIYAAAGTININNSEINSNSANTGNSVCFKKNVIYSINSNELVTVSTPINYNEDITPSTTSISIN